MTGCGLAVFSLEAFLTCIVKSGKCMRPCIVSMTTLLFLIKCNTIFGPVNFFITTKCSAKVLSANLTLNVVAANGFSNCPLPTCIWKLRRSSILRILFGAFSFFLCPSHSRRLHWQMLPSLPGRLPLVYCQNPEAHRAFLAFASGLLQKLMGDEPHLCFHLSPTLP